jgi:S-adenosylmethionine:tRNA ribosyltransferase-isomerase
MAKPVSISIEAYNYTLPEERIAKYPLEKRDHSNLLVYKDGAISRKRFNELADQLDSADQLFFNTTRVIQARLQFSKSTGARIEIFCLEPYLPSDYQLSFASKMSVKWKCLIGNSKKWKEGRLSSTIKIDGGQIAFHATKAGLADDKHIVEFSWDDENYSFAELLEIAGSTPIPPYLKREAEQSDASSYQTIYAQFNGSVAAPTAGLHFSDVIMERIRKMGIASSYLTLHVGAGTFIPVKDENAVSHHMHAELVTVDLALLESMLTGRRKIAVGTTSVRSLESLYWIGVLAIVNEEFSFENLVLPQWVAYELPTDYSFDQSIASLITIMKGMGLESFSFHTQIMITPGYKFKVIDGLITNFHQPKSTLLLLIAALVGDDWKKIYTFALENDFRFLSYGDSSLLWK